MRCPLDQEILKHTQFQNYSYSLCTKCEGLWLSQKEIVKIARTLDLKFPDINSIKVKDATLSDRDLKCPDDGSSLYIFNHRDVEIDICKTCSGVWFDRNEIEKIRRGGNDGGSFSLVGDVFAELCIGVLDTIFSA